jgi:hypothetical protein
MGDMTEAEWFACEDARELVQRVLHSGSSRKLRLFAVACCRCSRQLLLDKDHRRAVDLAERFADGHATEQALTNKYHEVNTWAITLGDLADAERDFRRWSEAIAVANAVKPFAEHWYASDAAADAVFNITRAAHRNIDKRLVALLRDVFGNPFRPVPLDPAWLTGDVLALARGVYDEKAFDRMPILADALQDAGCDNDTVLAHCRDTSLTHVRGCWVLDLLLVKA